VATLSFLGVSKIDIFKSHLLMQFEKRYAILHTRDAAPKKSEAKFAVSQADCAALETSANGV
jgi:hypothetical protein